MTPSFKSTPAFADIWIEATLFQSRFEEGNVILHIHEVEKKRVIWTIKNSQNRVRIIVETKQAVTLFWG